MSESTKCLVPECDEEAVYRTLSQFSVGHYCAGCLNRIDDTIGLHGVRVFRLPPKSVRQPRAAIAKPVAVNGVSPQRIVAERDSIASGATGTGVRKKGMHR